MEDKCYWWDSTERRCMHVNCPFSNCSGKSKLCNLYQKDFSYIETSALNESSSPEVIPMTYVETGIKDSGEQTVFSTGAVRDNHGEKGRMDLAPWNAIIELSKHCQRGAVHYGENNIRLGVPFHSLADSGARHLAKWMAGITDEPTHLVAACWNLMWLLEETLTRPDLNDMYWNKDDK